MLRSDTVGMCCSLIKGDVLDAAAVRRAVAGAEVVAHLGWVRNWERAGREIADANIRGASNVLAAAKEAGSRRIVFASSPHVYGSGCDPAPRTESGPLAPATVEGEQKAAVEAMLERCGAEWIAIRAALTVGRRIDTWLRKTLSAPVFFDSTASAGRPLQVIHLDDALEVYVRAVLDDAIGSGPVNLAALGETSLREVWAALRRPVVPANSGLGAVILKACRRRGRSSGAVTDAGLLQQTATMDIAHLRDDWGVTPTWTAAECVDELALAVRGRMTLNGKVFSLPWRITSIDVVPPVDEPAPDGVPPQLAGPADRNGEFDTPIDPRFPTFVATNLSEALPGPFSPAAASVSVRGMRAGGVAIAQRLRPGGMIQREIAIRTVGVFDHRLYLGVTASYFMAEGVPFVEPMTVLRQFFGHRVVGLPIFGSEPPPLPPGHLANGRRVLRSIGIFGTNLVGLTIGATHDTSDYVGDVDRLERQAGQDLINLDDRRLLHL
ncbi:MAG: NAD-dependent epimerase/dehydratase family protein, partial [Actinobacteria bacterium]|nr:NAD-dependent epimerase/dehydratase family protein [Actinomycetota bacterium]